MYTSNQKNNEMGVVHQFAKYNLLPIIYHSDKVDRKFYHNGHNSVDDSWAESIDESHEKKMELLALKSLGKYLNEENI